MSDLAKLKELVFESDNHACFIERERILSRLEDEMRDYTEADKYALIFSKLLAEVSTPILECDYFAGRVIEALPDEEIKAPNRLLFSNGHMNPNYAKMLKLGLKGILAEIKETAAKKGDPASLEFARNAEISVMAVKDYCLRYSTEAKKLGREEMAKALSIVPFEPAYDFYSALQGIWIMHMLSSCYVGSRDYAFGRFDQYILPFYEKALADGKSKQELTELLAGFMIKTNEICGRTTHNYAVKPVPSNASKQYINIGGENPNEFSSVILEAAAINNMAQPQITILLKPDASETFTNDVFEALSILTDKINIYNYDSIVKALLNQGIPYEVASDFTYSACCSFDLNYHTIRQEYYAPTIQTFVEAMHKKEYSSLEELIKEYTNDLNVVFQKYVNGAKNPYSINESRMRFVLDCLLLSDAAEECTYQIDPKVKYHILNIFCPAVATMGDSLMVLDKLVFKEKRYTYKEFMQILDNDYQNHEDLRNEILGYTMFGNDSDNDNYTVMVGNAYIEAVENLELPENYYVAAGFYSLERDNTWKLQIPATPNGRKSGEPLSENQSPTYGADKNGITALLKSLSKLPFDKTVTGGLNLTFSRKMPPDILKALIVSYFQMGGFHTGISVIDRETLKDAMINPEKYKSLTVRLYGFSEYFICLPEWQQLAILNRTEYN